MMPDDLTTLLVLGGARSGKSSFAQAAVEAVSGTLVYIATAQALDDEMTERIQHHRNDRGPRWQTLEAPYDLPAAIAEASASADAVLVDCLTLWLSNLLLADQDLDQAAEQLTEAVAACSVPLSLVSNEVGLGIVPDNALARRFRDAAGRLNQTMAASVDQVVLITAGLPLVLKSAR